MKSSFTARRVQPCTTKRGRKPVRGKKLLAFSTSPKTNTFSHGTNTLSMMNTASFSSRRDDQGWSNGLDITAAVISYDVRQRNFTPGALVGTMNTNANFL